MTIQEAAKEWSISEKTIMNYINQGYIFNLSAKDNQIILPNIPKPYILKCKQKDNTKIDKYIKNALNSNYYLSYTILGITQEKFEERLKALEREGNIYKKNSDQDDYITNLNYILSAKKDDKSFTLINIGNVNPTIQIGGVCIKN